MHINYFLRALIIGIVCISCSTTTFALEFDVGHIVKDFTDDIMKLPVVETKYTNAWPVVTAISPVTGTETRLETDKNGSIKTTVFELTPLLGEKKIIVYPFEGGNPFEGSIAPDGTVTGDPKAVEAATKAAADDKLINTITSEMVPGAHCICLKNGIATWTVDVACVGPITERKYQCTSAKWLSGFQEIFANLIRYVINIVLLLGVLAVVGLGIVWSFAGGDDVKMKSTLKTWAINIVVWLVILFMFRYILMFLAPWVYR